MIPYPRDFSRLFRISSTAAALATITPHTRRPLATAARPAALSPRTARGLAGVGAGAARPAPAEPPPPCPTLASPRALRRTAVRAGVRSGTGLPNIRIFGLQRAFSTIHLLPDSTRALSASFRIATRQTNRISAEYPHPPTAPRPRPGTRTQSVRSPVYSVLAAAKRACSRLSSCWPFFSSS